MKKIAVLAFAALLGLASVASADQGQWPKVRFKQVRWSSYGANGAALPLGTATDTTFFNGADATDTTGVIDISDMAVGSAIPGAVMTAAVPFLRVAIVGVETANVDSIYYSIDGSFDGISWMLGNTAGNFNSSAVFNITTDKVASWTLLSDPDANATAANMLTNMIFMFPKIRLRIKLGDQSANRISGAKFFVSYPVAEN